MARNVVKVSILGDAADLKRAFDAAGKSSKSFAQKFHNDAAILERWAKRGALAIAGIAAAVVGIAAKGGIARLMGLERANKQLRQLGVEGGDADVLMDRLLDTLRGTPFALDKGAASLAGFVASGRDLKDVPRLIDQVTDAAAFGNTTLEDMDFIWQRIQTTGRVTNEELKMLAERNIPVYTQLAGVFGKTGAEIFDMAKNGELSADMFFDAWEQAAEGTIEGTVKVAGAAKSMGDTTEGAWANMRTAMSRFGATLLQDIFPLAKDLFTAIGEGFDRMGEVLKSAFSDFDASGFEKFIEGIPEMMADAAQGVIDFWENTEILRKVALTTFRGIAEILQNKVVVAVGAVALALKALYAHPVIAGLGLLVTALGYAAKGAVEVKDEAHALLEELEDLSDLGKELRIGDMFTDDQITMMEQAGVAVADLADGTLSWAEAEAIVSGAIDNADDSTRRRVPALMGVLGVIESVAEAEAELTEAVNAEKRAAGDANVELRKYEQAQIDLAAATTGTKESTEEATTALQEYEAEVRSQVDPLFAYRQATIKVTEAQAAATAARDEFGDGSPEHIQSLLDLAEAGYDLEASLIRVAEQSSLTREQFESQLKQMGIFTDQEIQDILDEFARIEAFKFSDKSIKVNTTGSGPGLIGPDYAAAKGGSFKAGDTVLVGEEGPEIWKPKTAGDIIPLGSGGGSAIGGASINITVYGTVLTPTDLVDAIHEGLLQKQKRSGGLGLAG